MALERKKKDKRKLDDCLDWSLNSFYGMVTMIENPYKKSHNILKNETFKGILNLSGPESFALNCTSEMVFHSGCAIWPNGIL